MIGNKVTASGPDPRDTFEFRYKIVDLDDLIPSHLANLAPHPNFPADLQPRQRSREASRQQIRKIASKLQPDALIDDFKTLDRGPMIVEGQNRLTIDNVLIGEVWVCSGQSNMKFALRRAENGRDEAAAADFPRIRLFTVERAVAQQPQDDCQGRWVVCSPDSAGEFSAVGYFFGRQLHEQLDVPVGLIHASSCCTATIQTFMSRSALAADPEFAAVLEDMAELVATYEHGEPGSVSEATLARWRQAVAKARAEGKQPPPKPEANTDWYLGRNPPTGLFNGLIAPLTAFPIRGVIWYQGGSNVNEPTLYRRLLPAMIRDWRSQWGQGDFPFLFAQMANFQRRPHAPYQSKRAELREAQLMALSVPATGMAVTIDIGHPKRVYPPNKLDVGRRLALAAAKIAYGQDVAYSGPIYHSMNIEDGQVRIRFDHAAGGLTTADGGPPSAFAIAGPDRRFVEAEAAIDGQTVLVRSARVREPVAVRYGWADSPSCNLYNAAGLPASPFRTDDWPRVEADR